MPRAFWEDRDRRSLTFVNFMRIVLEDQIQRDASIRTMASDLGIESKTYREWINSIPFPEVHDSLLKTMNAKHSGEWPASMVALKSHLERQIEPLDRTVNPTNRSHAGLPTVEVFNRALEYCVPTVLERWAAQKHPNNSLSVAKVVADGLKWAFAYAPVRDIAARRSRLTQQAKELASATAELALLKEVAQPFLEGGADVVVSQRQNVLEAQIASALDLAKLEAVHYVTAIELVALDEDQWSEKSAGLYPYVPGPPIDSAATETHVKRIHGILESIAKISGNG